MSITAIYASIIEIRSLREAALLQAILHACSVGINFALRRLVSGVNGGHYLLH